MEAMFRKMAIIMATLYALVTVGVPVYQMHCACTGQSSISVMLASGSFVDAPHDDSHHCCANAPTSCCDQNETACGEACGHQHNCDKGEVKYIVFQSNTEPILSSPSVLQPAKVLDLVFAVLPNLGASVLRDALAARTLNNVLTEHPPLLFTSSPEFINFICQRKVMLG
jgi:hypothetical protein